MSLRYFSLPKLASYPHTDLLVHCHTEVEVRQRRQNPKNPEVLVIHVRSQAPPRITEAHPPWAKARKLEA